MGGRQGEKEMGLIGRDGAESDEQGRTRRQSETIRVERFLSCFGTLRDTFSRV